MGLREPNCPKCAEDAIIVTSKCVDGDESGLCFKCPRCGHTGWLSYDDMGA